MGLERDHPPLITAAQSPVRRPMNRAGMEFDLEGEVGPVRIQFTRQRVSRRGADYRVPASAALRYVAELERAGVPSRNSPSMGLEAFPEPTYWEWETTNFSPVVRPPYLSGIMSESMRKPALSVFHPFDARRIVRGNRG